MGTLNDRFQYVWYGTCDENENPCRELKFSDLPSESLAKIDSISTLGDSGMIKYDPSSSSSALDGFSCGKMYLVALKPSAVTSGGLTIANTLASSSMSRLQKYGISTTCNTTATPTPSPSPSPTPAICIPTGLTSVPHHTGTQPVSGIGNVVFGTVGTLGYDQSDFPVTDGFPRTYMIKLPNSTTPAAFITASNFPATGTEPMVYFEKGDDGSCYGGNLKPVTGTDNWEVTLSLLQ